MSDPKFTPGPWHVGDTNRANQQVFDADSWNVASCTIPNRPRGEAEANARLMAAAPDLYEALQECADSLADDLKAQYAGKLAYPSERRRYERDMAPVNKARAALAKAADGGEG